MTEPDTRKRNHDILHIPTREEFHRHFGGTCYEQDFCTERPTNYSNIDKGSTIADKIVTDMNWELGKLREKENRERFMINDFEIR